MVAQSHTTDYPSSAVLNPKLYKRLQRVFGSVVIEKAGQPAVIDDGRSIESGERYAVPCPFCDDDGPDRKLSFQHTWGVDDKGWSRVTCWKAGDSHYKKNPQLCNELRQRLFPPRIHGGRYVQKFVTSRMVREPDPNALPYTGPARLPGNRCLLTELSPFHPAFVYLTDRGFAPEELERDWRIEYCIDRGNDHHWAGCSQRIIIPVFQNGELAYWQGRIIEDNPYRPKYYNMSGPKGDLLYGLDEARALGWPFVIVVEGVTDVWRIGPGAVAPLGKGISARQVATIAKNWPQGLVLVFADDEAAWLSSAGLYDPLRQAGIPVVPFWSEDGRDPGAMTTDAAWALIAKAATAAGFDLLSLTR